jgi:hypothetical protein
MQAMADAAAVCVAPGSRSIGGMGCWIAGLEGFCWPLRGDAADIPGRATPDRPSSGRASSHALQQANYQGDQEVGKNGKGQPDDRVD